MSPFFGNSDSPSSNGQRKRLFISYAPDWILTIVLVAAFYFLNKVDGFKREFSVTDTSYTVHERVSDLALFFIAFVAPLVLQWIINILTTRSRWDAHTSALGLVLSLSLAGAFTQVATITVGRPRPDILDRCHPDPGTVDPPFGLSSVAICHQSDSSILNDGFTSFLSGHASLSFAGLAFLSLYITGKLHLFGSGRHVVWLSVAPLFGAALVSVSRTMDNRHHWQDVVVGSFLGILTAYFSYRFYYPSPTSAHAHLPYAPRIHRLDSALPIQYDPEDDPSHYYKPSGGEAEV
ncbi:putative diacylglycerol pyrophosphate phosphatase 1 [Lactarius tabidus]